MKRPPFKTGVPVGSPPKDNSLSPPREPYSRNPSSMRNTNAQIYNNNQGITMHTLEEYPSIANNNSMLSLEEFSVTHP